MAMIVSGFLIFFTGGVDQYAPTGYDNSSLVTLKAKFDQIQSLTNETKSEIDNIKGDAGVDDLFGLYLGKGIAAAKLTAGVVDTTNEIIDVGVDEIYGDSDYAVTIKTMIPTIILVVMFITILLHIITKSARV